MSGKDDFRSFQAYDFSEDAQFQLGLEKMKTSIHDSDMLLKAKLFYYNRCIHPINLEDYMKCGSVKGKDESSDEKHSVPLPTKVDHNEDLQQSLESHPETPQNTSDDTLKYSSSEAPQPDYMTDVKIESHTETEGGQNKPSKDDESKLSFTEIMEYVQKGQDIPGALQLNIEATNEAPTSSDKPRMKKPWETD